jgi:putative tryptophan/tyrosine transport system substrate-binding protein
MKKKIMSAVLLILLLPLTAYSAGPTISVSQIVEHPALDAVRKGFQDDLKDNGIDAIFHLHNAQGSMATAQQIAAQIVGERPDLILTIATPTSQAMAQTLKKAPHMRDTPMLFTAVTDPLAAGLVGNLQAPGGNITGVSDLLPVDKHMANVKRFFPQLKALGVMYNAGEANSKATVRQIRNAAKNLGFDVLDATVSKSADVYQAAQSLVGKVDVIFVPTDNTVVSGLESAVKVCVKHRVPLFCADVDSVARGAVAAMGFDYYKHGRQTGAMARRILAGASPGQTPVETQEDLQLHINLKFAGKMGIDIPRALIDGADKVYR